MLELDAADAEIKFPAIDNPELFKNEEEKVVKRWNCIRSVYFDSKFDLLVIFGGTEYWFELPAVEL